MKRLTKSKLSRSRSKVKTKRRIPKRIRRNPETEFKIEDLEAELISYLRKQRSQYTGEQDDPEIYAFVSDLLKEIDFIKRWDEDTVNNLMTSVDIKMEILSEMTKILEKYIPAIEMSGNHPKMGRLRPRLF